VFLAAGSLLLLRGFATSRVHSLDAANRSSAEEIAALVSAGALPPTLPVQAGQSAQVLNAAGQVLAVSPGTSRTLALVPPQTAVSLAQTGPASANIDQTAATGKNRILVRAVASGDVRDYVVVAEDLSDEQATLHSLARFVVIAVPILLLLVGAAMWLLLGRALSTVSALRLAAEDVRHPAGGLRLPVPESHDEVHALTLTLNAMLDRLGAAAAREQEFVGDVAHELRSPLAAVHTQVEVALGHTDAATRTELLTGALQDNERLTSLVDDLLTLARMESDIRLDAAPVDLAELADVETDAPYVVVGDRRALARAIENLTANAKRHAAQVQVSLSRPDASTIELRVDDDGPGVPPADRERIFERFVRLDDARARDVGGSGLGLAIARATAEAHGGTLRVEDSTYGGASFVLALPSEPARRH
jgi:signal transduction histidine kinase